jgi:toluene monooxygenase electron transfer component
MDVLIKTESGPVGFDSPAGMPILHSALGSGIDLPYECISGTCGTCKAKLLDGDVEKLWAEAPAWSLLKTGEYLLCQCAAKGSCHFQVKSLPPGRAPASTPGFRLGRIADFHHLNSDVIAFSVQLESPIEFEGQFFSVGFPGVQGSRCYSMVNSATPTTKLDFVVKRKPGGGVSEFLWKGDRTGLQVECFGPVGRAVFDPAAQKDILCIAGGSGIAGMMSIVERAADCGHFGDNEGHVFFGVRGNKDVFYLKELSRFAELHPRLNVHVALSDEHPGVELVQTYPALRFESGMVHEVAARSLSVAPSGDTSAFLAGPPPAVTAALKVLLLKLRIPASRIKYDKFS